MKSSMPRILIIDDDKFTLTLLRQAIEPVGYEVIQAGSAEEGIALFRENPTDIVITDLIMPGQSGLSVVEKLHKSHPSAKIFTITAGIGEKKNDFSRMSNILGAVRTFKKPVDIDALLLAIKEELSD